LPRADPLTGKRRFSGGSGKRADGREKAETQEKGGYTFKRPEGGAAGKKKRRSKGAKH